MRRIEFKVGQKVVCINAEFPSNGNYNPSLIKGKIYTVTGAMYCASCGRQLINIGLSSLEGWSVCRCGFHIVFSCVDWVYSTRFAPLDNLSESIEEAVSNEDYELAQTLTEVAQEQLIQTLL